MITINNNMYVLDTDNTSYAFAVLGSGQLEHLYYGRKLHANEAVMTEKHTFIPGNTNVYNKDYSSYSLEDVCLEMSSLGKGDIREPLSKSHILMEAVQRIWCLTGQRLYRARKNTIRFRGLMMIMERLNSSSSILRTGIIISHWSFIIMYMKM